LAKSDDGKRMIQEYYEIAPSIVEAIKKEENSNEIFNSIFNEIKELVSLIERGDLEGAILYCKKSIVKLKQKYLTKE
jgi:hypothetical protein